VTLLLPRRKVQITIQSTLLNLQKQAFSGYGFLKDTGLNERDMISVLANKAASQDGGTGLPGGRAKLLGRQILRKLMVTLKCPKSRLVV